jgi:CRISPR/Cas system-associated exonuclease Cas4 (RecB family)
MPEPLLLDQIALATFETCPRRFQLRDLEHLPWPSSPLDPKQSLAVERGQHFHRLVERYFLGLPVDAEAVDDDVVRDWWQRFTRSNLKIPARRRWPEHRLTIPARNSYLNGRFDLLVLGEEDGKPYARIYDWKTSRPRSTADLQSAWQTRLYLALAAESGRALFPEGRLLSPDRISMTYWYPAEADQPRVITYSKAEHQKNWSSIQELVAAIEAHDTREVWPLTDDWSHCRHCMYQAYCGRQEAGRVQAQSDSEEDESTLLETAELLEPQTP